MEWTPGTCFKNDHGNLVKEKCAHFAGWEKLQCGQN